MDSEESGVGGGGGKIRTRRYHLAAASSKPYPRNKQGIMTIVKESIKNIVPTWLQRYFTQNEETSPNEQRNLEGDINYHPAFADDITENALEIDGRITPEPTRITLGEPSTSRSSLNFTDILTRPSLHRSHINCNILDSPSPFSQPSTSTAFPVNNSRLSLGKEMKDSTSQHEDDNISTTSGFSSRASDKDITVSKNASVPPLWSAESERPVSLPQHLANSSKKPGFNLSAFGALSPSLGNASFLKASQLGNSPFYPGKTTYGGAAATTRQSKLRITPYQTPIRRQMKAKQASAQSYGVTSSTARRILQSLEKLSSPLADAKRIPSSVATSLSSPLENSMLNVTNFHSSRKRVETHYPPVQKLVTPKPVSRSMTHSQFFKPSLVSTAESSRVRQRLEINHKAGQEQRLTMELQSDQSKSVTSPTFTTSTANGLPPAIGSGGGKMRKERGIHYVPKSTQDEEMDIPALPEISLPISTSSLPKFSFGPLASSSGSSLTPSAAKTVTNKVQPASSPVFRFSSPIVKSTEAEMLPPVSIGGFKFSAPVAKSSDLSGSKNTSLSPQINSAVNSISNKKENEYDGPFKPAKILKEGSVLDILKSPDFASTTSESKSSSSITPYVETSTVVYTRPAISNFSGAVSGDPMKQMPTHWPHDTCLTQNKLAENKCISCQIPKVPTSSGTKQTETLTQNITIKSVVSSTEAQGFGHKFKAGVGTWDCDTCLVQNKSESAKCVACETPKPGTGVKQALVLPFVTDNATTTVSSSSSSTNVTNTLGFGDKFKKPKGAWECSVCLVSNLEENNQCVACQSDKAGSSIPVVSGSTSSLPTLSGGFLNLDKFKKPEGSWDCETCLVQNKADATKCIACESSKPGHKTEFKGFNTTTSEPSAPSFKFGIQSSSSSSSSELSQTAGKNFKFGEQAGFKFGTTSDLGSSGGFKFSKNEGSNPGSFSSESKSEESGKEGKNSTTFSFGLPAGASSSSTTSFQFGIANLGQQEKKDGANKPVLGSFTFGTSSIGATTPSERKTGISTFKFGNVEEKEIAESPFSSKKSEEKKEAPSAKGGFSFGNIDPVNAPPLTLGRTDEKKEVGASSTPLVFGKKAESEESKAQSMFSFGKTEQTKDNGTVKPAFNFGLAKPAEKPAEQQIKTTFAFGAQASSADPAPAKEAFTFLSSTSSNTPLPSVSLGGSSSSSSSGGGGSTIFSSTTSSSAPPPAFLFGQGNNTVSNSAFGNASDSNTTQSFGFAQDSKPPTTTSSTNTPVPFLFGSVAPTNITANTGFSFSAPTTTAPPTGSSSSFVFGSGSSVSTAGPAFGASQTPTFGQSQASNQTSTPTFGSLSSSSLFPASSLPAPPAFGTVSSSAQPSVFGQQANQPPGFGSGTAPSTGQVFQFGSSTANFNFSSSNPGIFTFGASSTAPAQPTGSSGFAFSQASSFNLGNNGKSIFPTGSSVPGRKIKTAVRRRK
ncbi:nuclear pore complex protein Nup153 isoform X2 [Ahaetulla prasina]|uniref:nuclear pore complex protein Nup153 isoform X2 n=1 Tax=Ahaetulla prasina TaxID=499056 RepID=UPI002647D2EE|nr:nuclear pore complex protein Nup153 isoform X2 [Ahaetulla prasina]